jgi:hypothetical protein
MYDLRSDALAVIDALIGERKIVGVATLNS